MNEGGGEVTVMRESAAKSLLKEYGVSSPDGILVDSLPEGLDLKFPVVLKVSDERILHKSDVGGVKLGIRNRRELEQEFGRMKRKFPDSLFLVEEMLPPGVEFILGVVNDPVFGRVIMLGSGGIYTELYHDVSFRKLPLTLIDAKEMLSEIKSEAFCSGFRGTRIDCGKLLDLIMKVSSMVVSSSFKIESMDLNPVIVTESDAAVADAKVSISVGGTG